ncbi:MAG: bacteriohopanetetrol glucosamine biosynthesis glycosyltransferase HpnI [Telluria sp.]
MAAGYLIVFVATVYALAALLCRARTWRGPPLSVKLPVTVLKPLCGIEPRLYENLATLCEQDWPQLQIVFGVRDRNDPAAGIVRELMRRHPEQHIELVVDARIHGTNFKVSNLMNMAIRARHPWIVVADSDIAVPRDWLDKLCAPLADPRTGIATCLYRARPLGGFWPHIGALFIDSWFIPSVRVASALGSSGFGFGASIALRAETLSAIGGFDALRNRLADDFWLGRLARERGLETVLADVVVTTDVAESNFAQLWHHERRWMKTIRSVNPAGFGFSFVTFTFPMLALGLCLAPAVPNIALALLGAAARCALQLRRPAPAFPAPGHVLYAPLRDFLLLLAWCSAFAGATTRWREHKVPVDDAP